MRIISMRLRFTTACLGVRSDPAGTGLKCFLRDGEGRIMFMQTWWDIGMAQVAKAYGKHHNDVKTIRWSPVVDGHPTEYRRYFRKDKYRRHEAFIEGAEVSVRAMVPNEITTADFTKMVAMFGEYFGISPFRSETGDPDGPTQNTGFGRFIVLEVQDAANQSQQDGQHVGGVAGRASVGSAVAGSDHEKDRAEVRPEGICEQEHQPG